MNPYLSLVVGGRNDDYGGNFLGRMRNFLEGVETLAVRYSVDTELVVVDWNPPHGEPLLADALAWPSAKRLRVRTIVVPADVHERLPNADRMPIFEYIAKNVGIRRAGGEYILATNPDLLFNKAVLRVFARRRLGRGCFYRADRYDVVPALPDGDYDHKLAFCARHFTRVNVWGEALAIDASSGWWRRTRLGLRTLEHRHFSGRPESRDPGDPVRRLHTNASGDFLLMHRDHWLDLRGYPELHTASQIDGYMCAIAASSGLAEVVLPRRCRVYHQEHPRAVDFSNLEATTRPLTSYDEFAERAREMLACDRPWIVNGGDWGLATSPLVDVEPRTGRRPSVGVAS